MLQEKKSDSLFNFRKIETFISHKNALFIFGSCSLEVLKLTKEMFVKIYVDTV